MRYEAECFTKAGIAKGYLVFFTESFTTHEDARVFANSPRLDKLIVEVAIVDTLTGKVVDTIHRV